MELMRKEVRTTFLKEVFTSEDGDDREVLGANRERGTPRSGMHKRLYASIVRLIRRGVICGEQFEFLLETLQARADVLPVRHAGFTRKSG